MNFETQLPEWKNEGTEPSAELQNNGFKEGYRPPAGVFNWFWHLVLKAVKELQTKLSFFHKNNTFEATSEDGVNYYVNSDSIPELYDGLKITVIPKFRTHTGKTVNLVVNGESAPIMRHVVDFAVNTEEYVDIGEQAFERDCCYNLMYLSEKWIMLDYPQMSPKALYGPVSIGKGGTGATTAEQALKNLGAAPYGYVEGYFELNSPDDFNAKVAELESVMDVRTAKVYVLSKKSHANEFPSGDYFVEIAKSYHGFSTATARVIHNGIWVILHRVLFDNTWGEWEWENPILYNGVEYRTTENWQGNPVYTKLVSYTPTSDIGNPNGPNECAIEFSTPNVRQLVRYCGTIENMGADGNPSPNPIPLFDGNAGYVGVNYMTHGGVALLVHRHVIRANTTILIQLWYTKQ